MATSISFAPAALVKSTILLTDKYYPRVFRAWRPGDKAASFHADRQAEYMSIQGLSLECPNQSLRGGYQDSTLETLRREARLHCLLSLPGLKYDPKHGTACHFRQLRTVTPSLRLSRAR